jgi:endonuclease YncB( thermonuclease family)
LGIAAALVGRASLDWRDEAPAVLADDAVVLSILDGQTLEMAAPNEAQPAIRVRLLGIRLVDDVAARQWLAATLVNKPVRIERDKRRRATDGAQLAYLYLGPTFVNAELIRRGWANHDPYPGDSASRAKLLREAQLK